MSIIKTLALAAAQHVAGSWQLPHTWQSPSSIHRTLLSLRLVFVYIQASGFEILTANMEQSLATFGSRTRSMKSNDVVALIVLGYAITGILVGLAIIRLAHYIRHLRDSLLTLTTKSGSADSASGSSDTDSESSQSSQPIAMPVPGPFPSSHGVVGGIGLHVPPFPFMGPRPPPLASPGL
ncbi:hypothetical protein QBC36DRAFT_307042 [Triangularia setosa]|uniref:Uncharacterized protein n=1 Tax=Triangularia setosa TaxID=2587417 RepID=A0AAN6WFJ9_9PEZI|nr:hypothetical protein QBC36DRAFT_307042 [Podospora setosa]